MRFQGSIAVLVLPALGGAFTPSRNVLTPQLIQTSTSRPTKFSHVTQSVMNSERRSSALEMATATAGSGNDEKSTALKMTAAASEESSFSLFELYKRGMGIVTTLFPLWTILFTAIALKKPQAFDFFTTEYFTAALAVLMLSMGITLSPDDFVKVAQRPNSVVMQFCLCYGMMPLLSLGLGKAFALDPALIAGMVLVGSINGGQASNLCTYIAKGNVALSVLMTTATTVGAIVMTPLLCKALLGAVVPVDAKGIAMSTIQVVLAPIALGMTTKKYFPKFVEAILPISPVLGVVSTCLLVGSAVAQVADPIMNAGLALQIPILLIHLLGGLVGYFLPRMTGFGEVACRTMAIETSMKSSAFGFLLAKLHLGAYAARVPSAVSVVWMALTGSLLAVVWRYIPVQPPKKFDRTLLEKYPPFQPKKFLKGLIGKSD